MPQTAARLVINRAFRLVIDGSAGVPDSELIRRGEAVRLFARQYSQGLGEWSRCSPADAARQIARYVLENSGL
jgi:hypothetical protein